MRKILGWYLIGGILFSVSISLLFTNLYISYRLEDIITSTKSQTFTKVSNLLENFENFIYIIELEMHKKGSEVLKILGEMFKDKSSWQNLNSSKLKEIAKQHNVDEIYLINENGTIEYTSFEPDIGLNLFSLDESFKDLLKNCFGTGQILSQRIALSALTGKLHKYLYHSPKDSNVIIEISYDIRKYVAEKFDDKVYNFLFKDIFSQIYSECNYVKNLDIYQLTRINCWSIINEGKRLTLTPAFVNMYLSNPHKAIITNENGNYVVYQGLKVPNNATMFALPPPLVRVEFDFSSLYEIPFKIKMIVFISALFSTIICYFVFSFLVSKRILNRIIEISNALEQLSSENYKFQLPVYGNDEIAIIAEKINKLAYERELKRFESLSAQNKLEEVKQFLFEILETLTNPVIAVDYDGHILHWNKSSEKLFNIPKDIAIGKSIWLTLPEFNDFKHIFIESINKYTNKEIKRYLYVNQQNNNRHILSISLTPMTTKNNLCTVVIHITDITEIEKLYEERRKVQQMQLISTLSSGMAHDINNLLLSISSLIRSILDKIDENPSQGLFNSYKNNFENLINSVNRAKSLLEKLLSINKNTEFRSEVLDLRTILKEVEKLLVVSSHPTVKIVINTPKEPLYILGDHLFLVQAILNICVNGIHAMTIMRSEGESWGGTLSIELSKLIGEAYENKYNIRLIISDEGVGIPKEIANQLFTPFTTTKLNQHGSGLGLAVANTIIEQHNGKIKVKSEPNKGTIFEIYLTEFVQQGQVEQIHNSYQEASLITTKSSQSNIQLDEITLQNPLKSSNYKVLVVDDEEIIRFTLQAFLEDHKFKIILANNGKDAINKFEEHKDEISIAILDLLMPEINGLAVAEQILKYKPNIPIIITTGFDSELNEIQDIKRKNIKILQKPYEFEQLLKTLIQILQESQESNQ